MNIAAPAQKARKQKTLESVALGGEPKLAENYTQSELIRALNWYNYECDKDKAIKWIRDYSKTRFSAEQSAFLVKNAAKIPSSLLALARMTSIGSPVAATKGEYLKQELNKFLALRMDDEDEEAAAPVVRTRKVRHSETPIAYVDGLFERSFFERVDTSGLYEKLLGMGLKNADHLADMYKLTLSDLKEFDNDEQLQEAYGHLSKPERTRAVKFIEGLVEQVSKFNVLKKANRTPRKVKAPSVEKLVKRVRFCETDATTGLKSAHPSKVVGANFVGVYNAKTRMLACYVGEKLSFKGSAIIGFDAEKSFAKKIRKPQDLAANFASGTQKKAERWFAELKTVASKPNGRTNSDSLFIRV